MKSLAEYHKKSMGDVIKEHFKLGWTFDKPYEKLILVALGILGLWKLIGFF